MGELGQYFGWYLWTLNLEGIGVRPPLQPQHLSSRATVSFLEALFTR